jgi:hypothetical protein
MSKKIRREMNRKRTKDIRDKKQDQRQRKTRGKTSGEISKRREEASVDKVQR